MLGDDDEQEAAREITAADPNQTRLPARVPLLLLPVRLETRFVNAATTGTSENTAAENTATEVDLAQIVVNRPTGLELLIRVYPDTISTSSFEPELTSAEITAGTSYWQTGWGSTASDPRRDAWTTLANQFGAPRAAWVAATMTPTNLGGTDAAPAFPSPATRASSYEKAPTAEALPQHWTVVLHNGTTSRTVQGGPITPGLAVGFTPHDGQLPDGLSVDAGMRWLVDFAEAEQVGMGIRVPLAASERAGFDRVYVFGVCDAPDDAPGQAQLAGLLTAHRFTDGFALVPQGAPTNNTSDASSAFSTADPNQAISYAVEADGDLATDPAADGPTLAATLRLPTGTFSHIRYADGTGGQNSADMVTALWPATLGYFLDQMMDPVFTAAQRETIRQFTRDYVRPRGPLAAVRVGATPYGILPTTSLAAVLAAEPTTSRLGSSNDRARNALAQLAERLLPSWDNGISAVPHIGASSDPDADLAQVLGMDASSLDYRGRRVVGDDLLWNMLVFANPGPPSEEWWTEHLARGRALLDGLQLTTWDPRVIHTSMGTDSYPVPYSSVQNAPLSETDPVAADAILDGAPVNYIQWLAHAAMDDVWAESYPGTKPTSILYRVLRQSMLREYVTQAGQAQVSSGLLDASVLREVELVNVAVETPTTTAYEITQRPYAAGSTLTWAKYLDALAAPPLESPLVQLADLRAALDRLAVLPSAELDRLLSETLDTASHRLDAWITAISTSLLADQLPNAAAQPPNSAGDAPTTTSTDTSVLHLGAYGWTEQVAPATARATVTGAEEAAVTKLDRARAQFASNTSSAAVQVPDPGSGGYLHAPSMTQAAAGAVLRSGYLSHQATPDEPTLAIDLSSTRVRTALWVLAGVRQGLSLGALTGFQFEEQLHEAGLDEYIQPFRDAYPLVGDDLTGTTASGVVTPIAQVVDGVKLRDAWKSGALTPGRPWGAGLPAAGDPAQTAITGMLEQIDDAMSALSDVSIAESVFQIMRGNYGRVGGILDALSRGDHPPDPDIVSTPRAGLDMTHRLMLLFAGAPPEPAAWSGVTTRPRAKAEPWLSAWVAGRLPDPATVRAQVTWTVGTQTDAASVSLRDLDIGPLDVLALADASGAPQRAELESRLLLAANPPAGADTITLTYGADHLLAGSVTFPDLLTAARAVRALVNSARPLDLAAFALPDKAPTTGAVDLAEAAGRVAGVVAALDTDLAALQAALTTLTATPDDTGAASAVVNALVTVSAYALPGALPAPGTSGAGLLDLGGRIVDQLQQHRAAVTGSAATLTDITDDAQAVLGGAMLLLPQLTPPDAGDLQSSFAQSAAMQAVDPQAVRRWLLQLSHVRDGAQRLDLAFATTRLLGAERPAVELAQLPVTASDRWLGLPLDENNPPGSGRVAIEAVTVGDPATASAYAGLLVDEWVERIPAASTTAGVAFHYDEPNARAPQAWLLAVCPDGRATWDRELIAQILDETYDLARIRGVDLASITEVGQILPALYFPFNLQAATPATTFAKELVIDDSVISAIKQFG
ncbi:MAG: hypothetical protein ABSF89_10995 [Acidimicrobiales bacterium]